MRGSAGILVLGPSFYAHGLVLGAVASASPLERRARTSVDVLARYGKRPLRPAERPSSDIRTTTVRAALVRLALKNAKSPANRGFMIGAPGFEPGTSSPTRRSGENGSTMRESRRMQGKHPFRPLEVV